MPNIASILKAEIVRVARKEARSEILGPQGHRASIAALRRELDALRKELRRSANPKQLERPETVEPADTEATPRRFSPSRLAAHRAKLGLSAAIYGRLLGLSGQTVYNWEQGKSRPNPQQIQRLAALKEMKVVDLQSALASASA